MKILFVCTANICRSVMAEGIFKKILSSSAIISPFNVRSAGVDALHGATPDRFTTQISGKHDIHIGSHRARQLTKNMLKETDLILCMSKEHKQSILGAYPKINKNIFLLKEYMREHSADDASIKDPTGRSKKYYEICYKEIEREIKRIVPLIVAEKIRKTISTF